jgi:hypothetical protein
MRYLVLSDIHSNLPALEAVLWDVEKRFPDWKDWTVVCLGDVIGYMASPNEVMDHIWTRSLVLQIIHSVKQPLQVFGALGLLGTDKFDETSFLFAQQVPIDVAEVDQELGHGDSPFYGNDDTQTNLPVNL